MGVEQPWVARVRHKSTPLKKSPQSTPQQRQLQVEQGAVVRWRTQERMRVVRSQSSAYYVRPSSPTSNRWRLILTQSTQSSSGPTRSQSMKNCSPTPRQTSEREGTILVYYGLKCTRATTRVCSSLPNHTQRAGLHGPWRVVQYSQIIPK